MVSSLARLSLEITVRWKADKVKGLEEKVKNGNSDKVECNIERWKFIAEIKVPLSPCYCCCSPYHAWFSGNNSSLTKENSESTFSWQGPSVLTVTGLHSFRMEPTKDGSATIFTQSENLKGPLSFLMKPSLLGKKMSKDFARFNEDLKARAEAT